MIQVLMSDDEFELVLAALATASATEVDTRIVVLGNALEGRAGRMSELSSEHATGSRRTSPYIGQR
jgi:hypothetical protein